MRFQGKVALITAAASGIGRTTAEIMVREGATMALVDNNQERLIAVMTALGENAHAYPAGALDEAQVAALVADVARRFGRVDILVNAVGGSTIIADPAAATQRPTLADWQGLLHFNLTGTFLFTHAVLPVMQRQQAGKTVNPASIARRGLSEASS